MLEIGFCSDSKELWIVPVTSRIRSGERREFSNPVVLQPATDDGRELLQQPLTERLRRKQVLVNGSTVSLGK